jgi:peptide deformylase
MPQILPIVINPNPILRKKSLEISSDRIKNKEFQQFCQDIALTMVEKDGVGLAAPQVSKNIRIIVVNTKDGPVCMINPQITKKSWTKEWGEEGCLSIPNTFGKVKRCRKIKCVYFDKNGEKINIAAFGLLARIIQHEVDHLDGILFIDKAKDIKKSL